MKNEIWKRKRNIERATSYRLEYCYCDGGEIEVEHRDFKSAKSLNQWADRNENGDNFAFLILKRLALIDEIWEPYTTIGKKNITLSDLVFIVEDLKSSLRKK